jgi:hypothetical protein
MKSQTHLAHIASRISHNNCPECRADCERRQVANRPFKYGHVHEYLSYVKPRLEAIRTGENGGNKASARQWHREFLRALDNRILSHVTREGRKYAPGYLERLRMASRSANMDFRIFASRGASCLDS